ncbi:MAG: glutamyl-tRNA reductase [Myxococcota bacterium]|nr:glutamyl-tRNA reductase [Myxococcota bacterium]MDW8361781.1 glutamyl-tRNA reductase [Myxococcales bacterium]
MSAMEPSGLVVVGLSHRTAPLDVRERLAVATASLGEELAVLRRCEGVGELVLLSTCNRVELYGAGPEPRALARAFGGYLEARADPDPLEGLTYSYEGRDAVRHCFRVASSLDSMVVGEPQILGQVKEAVTQAARAGTLGTLLGRCFEAAFATAKKVRAQTGIGAGAVSIASVAVELAARIFGSLEARRVLLVGAGEMAESAARALRGRGASLVVVNRNEERAARLAAELGGRAGSFDALGSELTATDVVLVSTASPTWVVTGEMMERVVRARRRRPLFLIDIAVPRNVDPQVGRLDNVFLYDVDDLEDVAAGNRERRRARAEQAERIVDAEVEAFERWRRALVLTPTIVALRERFRATVRAEIERLYAREARSDGPPGRGVEAAVEAIVNKLLHAPTDELRRALAEERSLPLLDALRTLFRLPEGPSGTASDGVEPEVHSGPRPVVREHEPEHESGPRVDPDDVGRAAGRGEP